MEKKPLVMYGGAFCPPHRDHMGTGGIVALLLSQIAHRVLIIPTGARSDKTYAGVPDSDRLHMLRLATRDYGDAVEIDTVCIDGYIDSTTTSQVQYLRREYGYDVPQVFGSDVASTMKSWDKTGYVAQTLPKIFLTRPGYPIDDRDVASYETIDFASRGFSSTEIRRRVMGILRNEDSVEDVRHMVQEKVLEYILERRLFVPRDTIFSPLRLG